MTSFKETLAALGDEEKAAVLAEGRFQEALKEWEEILVLRSALHPEPVASLSDDGDTLDRITSLVRRFGPTAAKWFGGPAVGAAATTLMADAGGFTGLFENFKLIGQVIGWLPGL